MVEKKDVAEKQFKNWIVGVFIFYVGIFVEVLDILIFPDISFFPICIIFLICGILLMAFGTVRKE